jgi:hypothetical protein
MLRERGRMLPHGHGAINRGRAVLIARWCEEIRLRLPLLPTVADARCLLPLRARRFGAAAGKGFLTIAP